MVNKNEQSAEGLGNRTLLDKVDKLRELGISGMVPLPQMVVVGDQSAGKSSVLESLTGFHFPRSVTLCTRHATEIICRREERESIIVSINPVDADEAKAKAFRREATHLDADEFAKIFQDAAEVMGIKSSDDDGSSMSAFSRDVLRVEISGPNEDHLTVIDVPGMFENETPGLTTKADIELVKTMVRDYINESRTIILAVVPCNGDIANQKILTYAAEADPDGKRTLGVLTKPDLAVENATQNVIVDLVRGKRRDLQLGYCLVKNRGADDYSSTADQRNKQEKMFFSQAPWNSLPSDRLGIPALKIRLQQLLMDRTKSEFPKVRAELTQKLKEYRDLIEDLGESRSTTEEQRIYIGKIAAEFNQIKNFGMDAYYTRHKVFDENPDLKLITHIREINERFSQVLHSKGHTRAFASTDNDKVEPKPAHDCKDDAVERDALYDGLAKFKIPSLGEDELDDILSDAYDCPRPSHEDIMEYIEREYLTSRGYEMGTFSGEMLPKTFKEQAKKWPMMAQAHASNAILVVHHFISTVLKSVCPNQTIRTELWAHLLEELQNKYKCAMDHANFLLNVEFAGKSITYNPAFEETLAKSQLGYATQIQSFAEQEIESGQQVSMLEKILDILGRKNSVDSTRRAIHDVLKCFYEISRSRFVDVFCQQVIDYYLLQAPGGPLNVLSDQAVLYLTAEQLDTIAGEDLISRERREKLTRDVADLTKAMKILKA